MSTMLVKLLVCSVSSPGRLQPSAEPDKLLPVVVWIHGGG